MTADDERAFVPLKRAYEAYVYRDVDGDGDFRVWVKMTDDSWFSVSDYGLDVRRLTGHVAGHRLVDFEDWNPAMWVRLW